MFRPSRIFWETASFCRKMLTSTQTRRWTGTQGLEELLWSFWPRGISPLSVWSWWYVLYSSTWLGHPLHISASAHLLARVSRYPRLGKQSMPSFSYWCSSPTESWCSSKFEILWIACRNLLQAWSKVQKFLCIALGLYNGGELAITIFQAQHDWGH